MKQTLLTITFVLGCLHIFAQNPCTPIGSDRCINAPLINSCQLDGWYSNTDPIGYNYSPNGDVPERGWCNGGFSIENNQWLRFTAIEDHLHIDVDVSECATGNGIQMGAYELGDAENCVGEQLACFGLASGANTSLVFEIENLVPGTEYLLMIDGWAGDGCPFTLFIESGIPPSVEVTANPLPICPGVDAEGALNAEISVGGGSNILYGWTASNGGNIVSGDFELSPIIDSPGDYTFFAYNVNTCCWASETVTVTTTTELPTAVASVVQHIDCANPTATLSAEGSETDNGFNVYEYLWSFEGGNPAGEGFILEGVIYPGIYILTVRNVSTGCTSEVQVEVLLDDTPPEITLLNPPVLNCIDTAIFLSVDAPIGSSFEWNTSEGFMSNEPAPMVNDTGTYQVIVTGANGCTNEATIQVTEDTQEPDLEILSPVLDCENTMAAITVTNDNEETSYTWNGPNFMSSEASPTISEAGTYFLTATNPNGCEAEFIVQVEENITPPDIEIEPAEILDCNLIAFSLSPNSESNIETYNWTGPDGFISMEDSPLINLPGTYNLEVTDEKGCMNTTSIVVAENTAEPSIALYPDNVLSCAISEVTIAGQSTDEITAYEWSDNLGTASSVEVSSPGLYFVTITGENGCTSIAELEVVENVAEPMPDAGPDAIITCAQSNTLLQGSGTAINQGEISYQWSLNGNVIDNTAAISVAATGTYELLITDEVNGCTAIDEVVVSADENVPEVVIEDFGMLDCNNASVVLSGENSSSGPDIIYTWLDADQNVINSANSIIEVNIAGDYTLLVQNTSNGCEAESPVSVIEDFEEPEPIVNNIGILNCLETNLSLEVENQNNLDNVSYQWFDADSGTLLGESNTLDLDVGGNYSVVATNNDNGCTNIFSFPVSQNIDTPSADPGSSFTITCLTEEAQLDASASQGSNLSFNWYDPQGNLLSNEQQTNTQVAGDYLLVVTNEESGCSDEASVSISISADFPIVMVEEFSTLNCNNPFVLLSGINSSNGADISYAWLDENGNQISSEVELEVSAAGDYTFMVINSANGCEAESPILVTADFEQPEPVVNNLGILNCLTSNLDLNVENQNALSNISYQWFNLDTGTEISEGTNLIISEAGNYNLLATNLDNGCTSEFPFPISENFDTPIADAGAPFTITCTDTQAQLDASASQGSNLTFNWFDSDGNLVSDQEQINTSLAGEYTLIVTNMESGCDDQASVTINTNAEFPEVLVTPPNILNCSSTSVTLDASNSQSVGALMYNWSTSTGIVLSNDSSVEVTEAGEYLVEIVDIENNCSASMRIEVEDDFSYPTSNAGPPQIITCDLNSVELDGSNSSLGNEYIYQWFNSNDVLIGETLTVDVENPDVYTLVVSNTANGCSSVNEVIVTPDENIPLVEIENDGILSCNRDEVNVFSTLATDPNYSYLWLDEDGQFISEEDSFSTQEAGVYTFLVTDTRNGCSNASSIMVDENFAAPEITLTAPDIINCNNSIIDITSSLTDSDMDVSYTWSNISGDELGDETVLSVNEAGTYQLTAFNNASGCSEVFTIQVEDNFEIQTAEPIVENILDCNNQSTLVNTEGIGATNYSYNWFDMDGNLFSEEADFSTDIAGEYNLILTNNANGCTSTAVAVVSEDFVIPSLSIPSVDDLNCAVFEVLLVSETNANLNFSFEWLDNSGNNLGSNPELLVDTPGEYILNATNLANGCSNTSSVSVIENINTPQAFIDDLSPLGLSCTQQSVVLDGSASTPVGNLSYAWFDSDGNLLSNMPIYEATEAGTYELIITDLTTFCTSESLTSISQNDDLPLANIADPEILNCNTSIINLNAELSDVGSNFTYTWNIPNGTSDFDDSEPLNPSTSTPGVYTITVLNTDTGCENEYQVEVLADFEAPIAQANAEDELDCVTSEVQLNANGSSEGSQYEVSWNIDGVTFTNLNFVTVQNSGTYNLVVTNTINGCTQEAFIDVIENTERPTEFDLTGDDITCFGFNDGFFQVNEIIGGTPPYSFIVNNQEFGELPSSENLGPGNYSLLVTDALGCTLETEVTIEEPPQVYVDLGEDITINLGESAFLTAASNVGQIDWYTQDSLDCIQDCFSQEVNPYISTLYEVEVMDENGCLATSDIVVNVQFDRAVYIPNAFSPNGDGINDFFRVFGNSSVLRVESMLIADRWGEIVFEAEDLQLDDEQEFWNGSHRSENLLNDVFVYYVVVEYIDGRTESFKGDFTLLR